MRDNNHVKYSAYMYVLRGEDYSLPYLQALNSVLWCDEIRVATDIRLDDGTIDNLRKFSTEHSHVVLYEKEFDFDVPNPHGRIKQDLRNSCTGDWLIEMDADEYFSQIHIEPLKDICSGASPNINLITVKQLNFFNGNWLKLSHPEYRPLISRNMKHIVHDINDINSHGRLGAAYLTSKGIKMPPNFQYNEPTIYNYGWYSLPRKWEMRQTVHYYEGKIQGKYNVLDDYTHNLDNEEVDFWDLPWVLPVDHYIGQIYSEMSQAFNDNVLKRYTKKHPPEMIDWMDEQRVVDWGPGVFRGVSNLVRHMFKVGVIGESV